MQEKRQREHKKRASTPGYLSPNQLVLEGFETPFDRRLSKENRWVKLASRIPWDAIVSRYDKLFTSKEGRPPISGRVILGSVIIKHLGNLTDRETIAQISENMYMQYFLGYSSFTDEEPFSPSLFVEIRERLSLEVLSAINEVIAVACLEREEQEKSKGEKDEGNCKEESSEGGNITNTQSVPVSEGELSRSDAEAKNKEKPNKGKLLMDASVAPQDITFPTDLKLLAAARRKSEELIDEIYTPALHGPVKVRTYREEARKAFLNTAKKKNKTTKELYKANGQQLRFLRRNLKHLDALLETYTFSGMVIPLKPREQKYLMVLHTVYEQQEQMHRNHKHQVSDRIVNIHQPHVRPMVRGKERITD